MFNMKTCEKYNMKKAFEEKRDFDFTIYMVIHPSFVSRSTKLVPVHRFTLFALTVLEASKITRSISVLPQYVCTMSLVTE